MVAVRALVRVLADGDRTPRRKARSVPACPGWRSHPPPGRAHAAGRAPKAGQGLTGWSHTAFSKDLGKGPQAETADPQA